MNSGIFQTLKNREIPLTIDDADKWFTTTVESKFQEAVPNIDLQQELKLAATTKTNYFYQQL
jgi:hypothetical protein